MLFSSRIILGVAFLLLTGIAEGVLAHQNSIRRRFIHGPRDAAKIEQGVALRSGMPQNIMVS